VVSQSYSSDPKTAMSSRKEGDFSSNDYSSRQLDISNIRGLMVDFADIHLSELSLTYLIQLFVRKQKLEVKVALV
jgi:hypothetical protein